MVDQKAEKANSYQMTLSSFLRHTDMLHMASFTSLPSNIMNNAPHIPPPAVENPPSIMI